MQAPSVSAKPARHHGRSPPKAQFLEDLASTQPGKLNQASAAPAAMPSRTPVTAQAQYAMPAMAIGVEKEETARFIGEACLAVPAWSASARPKDFLDLMAKLETRAHSPGVLAGLMVFGLGINGPQLSLVFTLAGNAVNSGLCGQHRMILIVVAVHAVSANGEQIFNSV